FRTAAGTTAAAPPLPFRVVHPIDCTRIWTTVHLRTGDPMRPTAPPHSPHQPRQPRRPRLPRRSHGTHAARLAAAAALLPALLVPSAVATTASAAPAPADGGAPAAETGDTLSPIPGQGPPTDPVYRLAGGCYTLRLASPASGGSAAADDSGGDSGGGYVTRTDDGYAATADAADAERFRTKAAQLGRFLLYGTDARMLTEAAESDLPAAGLRRD